MVKIERVSLLRKERSGALFVKGPIPLAWVRAAARAPGKSLQVGMELWFLAGLQGSRTVRVRPSYIAQAGVKRHAYYLALVALEENGLVRVARHRGRAPTVTICGTDPKGSDL